MDKMNKIIIVILFILLLLCVFILIIFRSKYNLNNFLSKSGGNELNWVENVRTAKELLDTTFKGLYNQNEEDLILKISEGPLDCNIWNDGINTIPFIVRKNLDNEFLLNENNKLYYPEKFCTIHCYYRKFFITRLQVLTKFYKPNSVILYYGAYNSSFLPHLIELFPTYIWHIYHIKTLPYILIPSDNVFIYNEQFTIETAKKWHGKIDTIISDLRQFPALTTDISLSRFELIIQSFTKTFFENIEMIRIIEPRMGAGLKFIIPDVDPTSTETIQIPKGKILWLPWSVSTSMDGTLVIEAPECKKNGTDMVINLSTMQSAISTHNRYYRPYGYYNLPIIEGISLDKLSNIYNNIKGYCCCFDCTCEATILNNYLKLNIIDLSLDKFMNNITFKYKLEPLIETIKIIIFHGTFSQKLLPALRIKLVSNSIHIGIHADTDIFKIEEYHKRLKENADNYDEFAISNNISDNTTNLKYHHNFNTNLHTATKLLQTKFKDMYTPKETKIILHASSKIHPLPHIWNDLINTIPYRGNKGGILAHNLVFCHLGQRKLFMSELQVLNRFLPDITMKATIVYAGAAPGIHTPLLLKLFPNTIWHLYDPNPFCHQLSELNKLELNKKRVYLYNEYFTDKIAGQWRNKCDIFICDIRLSADTQSEFEDQVDTDMRMQERWTHLIKPKLGASLKFRPPYLDEKIKDQVYKYLRGQILWQMWPPVASTECRLIVEASDIVTGAPQMEIDIVKYQNTCMYHNMIDRAWKAYEIPCKDVEHIEGYDRCYDCTCEAMTWIEYNNLKNVKKQSIDKWMGELTHVTHQQLKNKKSYHGYNQHELPAVRLSKI